MRASKALFDVFVKPRGSRVKAPSRFGAIFPRFFEHFLVFAAVLGFKQPKKDNLKIAK